MTINTLARLVDLEIRLYSVTTKSHLRIGAGEGSADISASENPIIRALIYRDGDEYRVPYLPGSSLHGVTRAWVEKALRSASAPVDPEQVATALEGLEQYKQQIRRDIADLVGKNADEISDTELLANWPVYRNVSDPLSLADQSERITRRDREASGWKAEKLQFWERIDRQNPCAASAIFGYPGQRGRVKITHAFPSGTIGDAMPVDIITRVAINRLTGAADDAKLFDVEAVPPGVTFYFFVIMENMTAEQKRDFNKGIRAMNLQLANLGAHGTVGFGQVQVEQVYAAALQPSIFDLELESVLPEVVPPVYTLQVPLDREKYPEFFLALSSVTSDGQTPSAFADHIAYI